MVKVLTSGSQGRSGRCRAEVSGRSLRFPADARFGEICPRQTSWLPRTYWRSFMGLPSGVVKNVDLWQRLDAALSRHDVQWHWVKEAPRAPGERAGRPAGGARPAGDARGEVTPGRRSVAGS
jgi:hypothetical protein